VETQVEIARNLDFLEAEPYDALNGLIESVQKQIGERLSL
jgi:hypothetical protein